MQDADRYPLLPCAALMFAACLPHPGGFSRAEPLEGPPYTAFSSPERVTLLGYDGDAMEPFVTRDGAYLLFNNRNDPGVDTDLFFARRVDDLVFESQGELVGANSTSLDGVPTMDRDGVLMFVSPRSYDDTLSTIYAARFDAGVVDAPVLVAGLSRREPLVVNFDIEVSEDGGTVYFVDGVIKPDGGPPTDADLVIAVRVGDRFERHPDSARLLANVNSVALEYAAAVSSDELELFFTRVDLRERDPSPAIYRAVRASVDEPFGVPSRVAAAAGFVEGATVSADGTSLYYHHLDGERFVLERIQRPLTGI